MDSAIAHRPTQVSAATIGRDDSSKSAASYWTKRHPMAGFGVELRGRQRGDNAGFLNQRIR